MKNNFDDHLETKFEVETLSNSPKACKSYEKEYAMQPIS